MKTGKWCYVLPVIGAAFGLWYVWAAFADVVYSDYIRLVNSYLPDVWDPDKFFVGDILTRIPLNYAARIINVTFFDYSIRFDQVLGILFLGVSALQITSYCMRQKISAIWVLSLMVLIFSLNKWEMMINGSGWIHFLAFTGFYCHYLVLERVWRGEERKHDHIWLLILPWIVTIGMAGPYCAIYTVVLLLTYGFRTVLGNARGDLWEKRYLLYGVSAVAPLLLYMVSSSLAEPEKLGVADVPLLTQLLDTPGFFLRFFIKSFASMAVGVECAQAVFSGNLPYYILGAVVMAGYGLALWQQRRYRLYEETIFPLMLLCAGGLNHILILVSRGVFLREDYGMSSRYALQFQVGILGMALTFGLVWKKMADGEMPKGRTRGRWAVTGKVLTRCFMAGIMVLLLAGNGYTTVQEVKKAPYRKERCIERAEIALDFENRTDEELKANFEYHMSRPEGGQEVRAALEILKKQQWNIFRQQK